MSEGKVIPSHALNVAHVGRVQGERPLPLRDGLLDTPPVYENPGLYVVSRRVGWIEREGLRHLSIRPRA